VSETLTDFAQGKRFDEFGAAAQARGEQSGRRQSNFRVFETNNADFSFF